MTGVPLLDLHDLGLRQTGNESWARSLAAAMFASDGPESYDIAVTSAVPSEDLELLPARRQVAVSQSSARRLAIDLPRAVRRLGSSSVLVQYTAPLTRVPTVVMVHDVSFEQPRSREWLPLATRLRYRSTIRASVRRAAHVLTVSEFSKADLVRVYDLDPDRVTVVPNAVDPRLMEDLARTPVTRQGRPTVLMVGNVLPRKNLPMLARAVRLMRDRGEDVALCVIGNVQAAGRRDARTARELLRDDVSFSGYVARETLARELRSAHVLAFPSLFEGFGIPALEAMAAGLPVVVSDQAALPEVVGGAGLVVPAEDPEAWATALGRLLEPEEGARWSIAGSGRVAQFGWHRSARLTAAVLAQAVRPGARDGRSSDLA
jgi:glycosyltransferase involved in cell wall biosynthesis